MIATKEKKKISVVDESFLLDPIQYTEKLLWIRSKKGNIIPFYLNSVQRYIEEEKQKVVAQGKSPHYLILKYRRGGITTWEQAKSFHLCATYSGQYCLTLAHDTESTQKIFDIAQLYYDTIDNFYKPSRQSQNKRELSFDKLGSKFYIGTAGSSAFGRGQTLQRLHGSEVAFWPHENGDDGKDKPTNLIAGLLEACAGEVVFETTPNGRKGFFFHEWQRAKRGDSTFSPIFIPWWVDEQNRISLLEGEELDYTEEERFLSEKHNLSEEQIKFRRHKQKTLKGLFLQEYPEDDVSCFIASSHSFFDISKITQQIKYCNPPIEVRDNNCLKIYKRPIPQRRYVAGSDVGGGRPGSDYSCTGILDFETNEQVAFLHGRWSPQVFAKKSARLCQEYNKALWAIEENNHGHSALNTALNTLHYSNLYYHKDYDNIGGKRLGWQTNGKTRPLMLDSLANNIDENLMIINDKDFLDECIDFVDNGTGKYEAAQGKHDDRIIMWAIASYVRDNPQRKKRIGKFGKRDYRK